MLRVRYFGDLHVEFTDNWPLRVRSIGEDLVVLAGDISNGIAGIHWAREAFSGRPVVYVLGNHEFYGYDFDALIDDARAESAGTNVHLLENNCFEFSGYRILGCTLWTDFRLFGESQALNATNTARERMYDYRVITRNGRRLSIRDTTERCRHSKAWLADAIAASNRPAIVVTHHAPTYVTGNPYFGGGSVLERIGSAAFHNNFDAMIVPPVHAWIHGHTHYSVAERVNGIPVVTNQRGYPGEPVGDFSWQRILEI